MKQGVREEEEEGLFKAKAVNEVDDDVTPRRRRDTAEIRQQTGGGGTTK